MQLTELELTNFLCFDSLKLDLGGRKINVFLGRNGQGKSSIRDAIAFLLVGRCRHLQSRSDDLASLIRSGAEQASVEGVINGIRLVRKIGLKEESLFIDGRKGTIGDLERILGFRQDQINLVLDSATFLRMSDDERCELVFGVLGNQNPLTLEMIEAYLDSKGHSVESSFLMKVVNSVAHLPLVEGLDQVYERCYARRREENARVKALKALVPLKNHLDKANIGEANLEVFAKNLAESRSQLERLIEIRSRREAQNREKLMLESQKTDLLHQLRLLDQVPSEVNSWSDFRQGIDKSSLPASQENVQPHYCPVAQKTICLLPRTEYVHFIESQLSELQSIDHLQEKPECAGIDLDRTAERLRLQLKVAEVERLLTGLETEDSSRVEAQIRECRQQIAVLEQKVSEATSRMALAEQDQKNQVHLEKAQRHAQIFDILVKAFSARGIKAHLVRTTLHTLAQTINTRLTTLVDTPWRIKFGISEDRKGNRISFQTWILRGNQKTPLASMSSSERLRVGLAIQDAIARLSGVRMIVFDEADALDDSNRQMLFRSVLAMQTELDFMAMLATSNRKQSEIQPHPSGLIDYWWVENGTVQKIA